MAGKLYGFFSMLSFMMCLTCLGQSESNLYFEGTFSYKVELKGEMAENIKLNKPNTSIQMHIKEGSYIVNLKGGDYPKSFIFVSDSNWLYSINMAESVAYKYSSHNDRALSAKLPEAKLTGKKDTIMNIPCDIYVARSEDARFLYFVNDEYRIDTTLYNDSTNARANFLVSGLEGKIPLRSVKQTKGLTVVTTVTDISPQRFDEEQFRIPFTFELKKRDYRF